MGKRVIARHECLISRPDPKVPKVRPAILKLSSKPDNSLFPERSCVVCGTETDEKLTLKTWIPKRSSPKTVLKELGITILVVDCLFVPALILKGRMPFAYALFVFTILACGGYFISRTLLSKGKEKSEHLELEVSLCKTCRDRRPKGSRLAGFLFLLGFGLLFLGLVPGWVGLTKGITFLVISGTVGIVSMMTALIVTSIANRGHRNPLICEKVDALYFLKVYSHLVADHIAQKANIGVRSRY